MRWEIAKSEDYENMDVDHLIFFQKLFVKFKGLYEGMYKGFYRNMFLEKVIDENECLGDQSFESLDMIMRAISSLHSGNLVLQT
mmetsp:Transcript_14296/g.24334  ORF Transcript_14296/g.24334 Transcript_14296/m.24334 type:complete len:84 (+) Transcript_14296:272-523(+)